MIRILILYCSQEGSALPSTPPPTEYVWSILCTFHREDLSKCYKHFLLEYHEKKHFSLGEETMPGSKKGGYAGLEAGIPTANMFSEQDTSKDR